MKLVTLNNNSLFVKSMGKLHKVVEILRNPSHEQSVEMLHKKQLICVAGIPGLEGYELIADAYSGCTKTKLDSNEIDGVPSTEMYIQAYNGDFYQIAFVSEDMEVGDKTCTDLPGDQVGLIDSTDYKLHKEGLELHFWAFIDKSKVTIKK